MPCSPGRELFCESEGSVLLVVTGVKSARQLNSSAEYDVVDDDDVDEGGLFV